MAAAETTPSAKVLYKILLQSQWQSWLSQPLRAIPGSSHMVHLFTGAGIDIQDGYIHLSTAAQSAGTYEKWFAGANPAEKKTAAHTADEQTAGEPLVLVEIDARKIVGQVKWEFASSRGEAFAHVYDGGLPYVPRGGEGEGISAVLRIWEGDQVTSALFDEIRKEN